MNNLLPGLAQRLAALTRESVQTTGPIAALSDQLPEFEPGERYTARILQNLRDGLARADVGGQTVTLRLPQTIPEGRTVALTHVGRSAQTLVATLDGDNAAPTDGDAPADVAASLGFADQAHLSRAIRALGGDSLALVALIPTLVRQIRKRRTSP